MTAPELPRFLIDPEASLAEIRRSPRDAGIVERIARRPSSGERELLAEAVLDPALGLEGDDWARRRARTTPDGAPDPERQLTLINVRAIRAVAGDRPWELAGDQLYVDLALGPDSLPPGTRLRAGTAVLEVTAAPHAGCAKFTARFGSEATRWFNSPEGRALCLRGIHARVVERGIVRPGETIAKL